MPEVPIPLSVEPELRGCAKELRKAQGCIRRDSAMAVDDLVNPRKRDVDSLGEFGLGHSERLEKLLKEHLTGMGRRSVLRKHQPRFLYLW